MKVAGCRAAALHAYPLRTEVTLR